MVSHFYLYHGGDGKRSGFGVFRNRTGEEFITGGVKEGEPPVEMRLFELFFPVQLDMRLHGVSAVQRLAQQDRLPEIVHNGEMGVPIEFGDLGKERADQLILSDLFVEGIDEQGDILAGLDVFYNRCHKIRLNEKRGNIHFKAFYRPAFDNS